jgi:hypothetical protein
MSRAESGEHNGRGKARELSNGGGIRRDGESIWLEEGRKMNNRRRQEEELLYGVTYVVGAA